MDRPIVTVIVPNYNHSSYLNLRIDSILNQSYSDFELILLDDCSSDDSRDILLSYKNEPRVSHIVFNEKNSGTTFKQWEKGISLSKGKYIWLAESDDFADPDFLHTTVSALEKNPDATIAFTGSQLVDDKSEVIASDWDKFTNNAPDQIKFDGKSFLFQKMIWENSIYNASMVVFRRECLDNVSNKYKEYRYCGDWLFWIEICKQGNVICINRKLNYFRQHANKVSPKAVREGLYYTEGGEIILYMMSLLQLSNYQKKVVIGRSLKKYLKELKTHKALKQKVETTHPSLFKSDHWAILIYKFDKVFNFSRLHGA